MLTQTEMEVKVREVTRVTDPGKEFVETLWQKIEQQSPLNESPLQKRAIYRRPAFVILILTLLMLGGLFIGFGPKKVSAFIRNIFNNYDLGLQAVEEAGLVTHLNLTTQPENFSTDSRIDGLELTLDWVYIDESRFVIQFIPETIPTGLTFDFPSATLITPSHEKFTPANRTMGFSGSQLLVTFYHPIEVQHFGELITINLDLNLISEDDSTKEALATYHFDLENIPVYTGATYPVNQSLEIPHIQVIATSDGENANNHKRVAVAGEDISFQVISIKILPSFTEVEFCSTLSSIDLITLPKGDITLQVNDSPIVFNPIFLITEFSKDQTCGSLGFNIGSLTGLESVSFRIKSSCIKMNTIAQPEVKKIKH